MDHGDARNSVTQLRRGALEYCVLALLRDGERYGFELVRALSDVDGMVTSEGTIYPLLSRLRRDHLVTTSWQESESGPPRRYYRLTDAGHAALAEFAAEWARFRDAVDTLLGSSNGSRGGSNIKSHSGSNNGLSNGSDSESPIGSEHGHGERTA